MNHFIKGCMAVFLFTVLGYGQIDNVQFTDLKGRSWDLHKVLGEGKFVYIYFTWNG